VRRKQSDSPAADNRLTLSACPPVVKIRGGGEKQRDAEPQDFEGMERSSVREKDESFGVGHSLLDILRLFRFSQ
jgi:hypothetical protein